MVLPALLLLLLLQTEEKRFKDLARRSSSAGAKQVGSLETTSTSSSVGAAAAGDSPSTSATDDGDEVSTTSGESGATASSTSGGDSSNEEGVGMGAGVAGSRYEALLSASDGEEDEEGGGGGAEGAARTQARPLSNGYSQQKQQQEKGNGTVAVSSCNGWGEAVSPVENEVADPGLSNGKPSSPCGDSQGASSSAAAGRAGEASAGLGDQADSADACCSSQGVVAVQPSWGNLSVTGSVNPLARKSLLPPSPPSRPGDTCIDEVFGGVLVSHITCSHCQYVSTSYEPFLDLSLCIPQQDEDGAGGRKKGSLLSRFRGRGKKGKGQGEAAAVEEDGEGAAAGTIDDAEQQQRQGLSYKERRKLAQEAKKAARQQKKQKKGKQKQKGHQSDEDEEQQQQQDEQHVGEDEQQQVTSPRDGAASKAFTASRGVMNGGTGGFDGLALPEPGGSDIASSSSNADTSTHSAPPQSEPGCFPVSISLTSVASLGSMLPGSSSSAAAAGTPGTGPPTPKPLHRRFGSLGSLSALTGALRGRHSRQNSKDSVALDAAAAAAVAAAATATGPGATTGGSSVLNGACLLPSGPLAKGSAIAEGAVPAGAGAELGAAAGVYANGNAATLASAALGPLGHTSGVGAGQGVPLDPDSPRVTLGTNFSAFGGYPVAMPLSPGVVAYSGCIPEGDESGLEGGTGRKGSHSTSGGGHMLSPFATAAEGAVAGVDARPGAGSQGLCNGSSSVGKVVGIDAAAAAAAPGSAVASTQPSIATDGSDAPAADAAAANGAVVLNGIAAAAGAGGGNVPDGPVAVSHCLRGFFTSELVTWGCPKERAELKAAAVAARGSPGPPAADVDAVRNGVGSSQAMTIVGAAAGQAGVGMNGVFGASPGSVPFGSFKRVSFSAGHPEVIFVPGSVEQRGTPLEAALAGSAPFTRPITVEGVPLVLSAKLQRASRGVEAVEGMGREEEWRRLVLWLGPLSSDGSAKAARVLPGGQKVELGVVELPPVSQVRRGRMGGMRV